MDDFDNFFSNEDPRDQYRTPVYHTPNNQTPPHKDKTKPAVVMCIIATVFMCIILLVNVIVLATLKDEIADRYSAAIAKEMRDQYSNAISDSLNDTDIVNDVVDKATEEAVGMLKKSIGEIAAEKMSSVVTINGVISSSSNMVVGAGFIIGSGDTRYVMTNAHVVLYEKETRISSSPWASSTYEFAPVDKIYCYFDGDSTKYELSLVAVGAYRGEKTSDTSYTTKPDLAILTFKGVQPDIAEHPSLSFSSQAPATGDQVAIIGNPENYGLSIATGTISNASPNADKFTSWGYGKFIMTDAAVNHGNSGGPMLDKFGKVIGVVESKLVDEEIDNMGFAVSAETALDFIRWAELGANNELNTDINIAA